MSNMPSVLLMGKISETLCEQPAADLIHDAEANLPADDKGYHTDRRPLAYINVFGDNKVALVDIRRGTKLTDIGVGRAPTGIDISPDQRFVYAANTGDNTLSVIRTSNNKVIDTINLNTTDFVSSLPGGVTVSPDGQLVYVANRNSANISIVDARKRLVINEIPLPPGSHPLIIKIAPGRQLAFVTLLEANQVAVIDLNINLPVKFIDLNQIAWPTGICIAENQPLALVTNQADDSVWVVNTDLAETASSYPIGVGTSPYDVCFAPSETRAYVASSSDGTVDSLNVFLHRTESAIEAGQDPAWLGVTESGRYIVVSNVNEGTAAVINTRSQEIKTIAIGSAPQLIAIKEE